MSERYQNCPMCGSLCEIGGDKKEGTHYYMPVSDNAELQAENAELWAFVEKIAKVQKPSVRFCSNEIEFINDARILLQKRKAAR